MLCATNGVPIPYELTPRQRRGRILGRRAHLRDETGLRDGSQALGRDGLPQRGVEGDLGRDGHPSEYRALSTSTRGQAASRDRHLELEEGVQCGRNVGDHFGGPCNKDLEL